MEVIRRHRLLAVLGIVGIAALVAVVLVGAGGGGSAPRPARVHFFPGAAAAAPDAGLAWWTPVHGEPLGVAVDGPDVVTAALDEVRLLDGRDGATRWKAPVVGVRRYRPAVAADRVAATGETELVLLDRRDGRRVATVPFEGPGPAGFVAGPDRLLVAAGSERGALVVADAADGTVRWTAAYPGEVPVPPRGAGATMVAAWHTDAGSTLRALDVLTGALRWEVPLGAVAGSPVVVGETVVVAHGDGIHGAGVDGLDLATGTVRWRTALPGWWDGALEGAAGGGRVYLLDGMGTVVALDPATGAVQWRRETGRPLVDGRLALTPDAVVFASYDDELLTLDRATGAVRSVVAQAGVPVDVAAAPERLVVALRLARPSRVEARPVP